MLACFILSALMPVFVISCRVVKSVVCQPVAVSVMKLPSWGSDEVILSE